MLRRTFIKSLGAAAIASMTLAGYAVGHEPFRLATTAYEIKPANWPSDFQLKIAVLADLHACEPWMPASRIARIVERTNALRPDLIVLLGDYTPAMKLVTDDVAPPEWAAALARLHAPLGIHAVLGNHDWWNDEAAQRRGHGPTEAELALRDAGIPVLQNRAIRLEKDGYGFWLAGLGDQVALKANSAYGRYTDRGLHDLPGTLAQISDEAPVILLAHEPDIFARMPARVTLTLCGHTHGGQIRLFGYSPVVPSHYGNRYAYGHVAEPDPVSGGMRHLIVSGGLGCSIAPVRFGVPPEIVLVTLSASSRPA